LLDRITELAPPELARGVKCVSLSDDIFVDHFPGHPVMPGALILESLAQLAGVLLEATLRERGRHDLHALLTMADRAKFRRIVRPGDKLELEARGLSATEDGGVAQAFARVDGTLVAEAQLSFAFAQVTNPKVLAKRREFLDIWLSGSAGDL
jgi:3-hydroxymyristoyl/3-hydroxydecanoyl-(acyl carrier protein) dehydratase